MVVFPIGHHCNDKALMVVVKIKRGVYVRCLCIFDTEEAHILKCSNHYSSSLYGNGVKQALLEFGFNLISDDSLAYLNWLYDARIFSNRI